ncbi:unnamed protein product [Citrullus colocynthis]|uniref:Uncharacterized protein n=1 Tax=Citrullus colocynthis TaxID=252529 RepID=A0ABP0XXV4_9ROSI
MRKNSSPQTTAHGPRPNSIQNPRVAVVPTRLIGAKAFPWRQSICRTIMASSPFYASINNGFFNRLSLCAFVPIRFWKFVDDGDDGHCTPLESSERRGRSKMVWLWPLHSGRLCSIWTAPFRPYGLCESEMEQCSTAVVWTEWKKHCLSSRECLQEGTCNNNICGAPTPSTFQFLVFQSALELCISDHALIKLELRPPVEIQLHHNNEFIIARSKK